MTAPLERTVNPQDLDPHTVRLLPYPFAKAKGVLAARVAGGALEVWIRPYPQASTLAEVRRMAGKPLKEIACFRIIGLGGFKQRQRQSVACSRCIAMAAESAQKLAETRGGEGVIPVVVRLARAGQQPENLGQRQRLERSLEHQYPHGTTRGLPEVSPGTSRRITRGNSTTPLAFGSLLRMN